MTAGLDERLSAPGQPVPPAKRSLQWSRENLFGSWSDTLLTLVFGALIIWATVSLARFVLDADFTIVRRNLTTFMVGRFPRDELWRPWLATGLIGVMIGVVIGSATTTAREKAVEAGLPYRESTMRDALRRFWPLLALIGVALAFTRTFLPFVLTMGVFAVSALARSAGLRFPAGVRRRIWVIALALLLGAYLALSAFGGRGWDDWGGLHLNLFLTVAGILLAFPIGILFALGRRSGLPALRWVSVTYIEFVRGVPLITLLLFGAFALGFVLPADLRPGVITRMLVAITLFEAAYVAEVVRGGLQSVHPGQVEAGQALGLSPWRVTRRIVLPQALRNTIPAMVGQFISLWKDTTLVAVLGILDLLEASRVVNTQPDFLGQGLFAITLGFAGLVFWVVSYTMSREARRLERKLGVGER